MSDLFRQVEATDLVKFGLIPEFIGRLPVIATLDELDEDALMQILTEPKNALTRQYQYLFEMENVDLVFEDAALRAVAKKPLNVIQVRVVCVQFWKMPCSKPCTTCQAVPMLAQW